MTPTITHALSITKTFMITTLFELTLTDSVDQMFSKNKMVLGVCVSYISNGPLAN